MFKHTPKPNIESVTQRGREPVQPPKILEHIKIQVLLSGEQLLAHMFSAIDDLFYDLSKRASSNNEANLYFEAMRDIRIAREGTAKRFLQTLSASFSTLVDLNRFGMDRQKTTTEMANLSIVEGDDLEIDLARTTMISRTRGIYHEELHELTARLDHLLLQIAIDENNNPLDPQQVTNAFIEACQDQLFINIKAKLIVFKMFEKHLLSQLGHIYSDANQTLMDAGILPKVPRQLNKNPDTQKPEVAPATPPPQATAEAMQPQAAFTMNQNALGILMAAARRASFSSRSRGQTPIINCYIYTTNPGPLMASAELASLLTHSQQRIEQQLEQQQADVIPRNIIGDIVTDLLASNDPAEPQALEQEDEDIINLVAMFFDQILADDNLPTAVQSLICRLQIPILKVAIRDRRFFVNADHPARRLINCLTAAGLELDDSKPLEKDPGYRKMLEVVQYINRHYQSDDTIFQEAEQSLKELLDKEKRKSNLVEQRTLQAEEGQYRMLQARLMAQNLIYEKIKDQALPDDISEFLTTHWLQVLIFVCLKQGADSGEWMSAEQTVIDLVWLSHEHDDQRSLSRRERMLPELLDRIEAGLESLVGDQHSRSQIVDGIEATLRAISKRQLAPHQFHNLTDLQREELGRGQNGQKAWSEMTAIERQMARHEELFNQFYVAAKDMPIGTWIDYRDEHSGKQLRAKLSAKIDSDSYMFVNRLGFKVLEKTRKKLALDLQNRRVRILDTRPLFDRIMALLVGRLEEAS